MAFLWSSSSVRAYRPPLMPLFLLFRVSCIIIRLHVAVRPRVTGAQHPGKHLVTREGPGHPSEARIPRPGRVSSYSLTALSDSTLNHRAKRSFE